MSNNKKRPQRYHNWKKKNFPVCPICGKSVRYLLTAIAVNEDKVPAHFDCVLKAVTEAEELAPKERICYLGNGSFGVVKFRNGQGGQRFTVRKRIQYEDTESIAEWRRKISNRIRRK